MPERAEDVTRFPIIGFSPLFWSREWRFLRGEEVQAVPVSPMLSVNSTAALRSALLITTKVRRFADHLAPFLRQRLGNTD